MSSTEPPSRSPPMQQKWRMPNLRLPPAAGLGPAPPQSQPHLSGTSPIQGPTKSVAARRRATVIVSGAVAVDAVSIGDAQPPARGSRTPVRWRLELGRHCPWLTRKPQATSASTPCGSGEPSRAGTAQCRHQWCAHGPGRRGDQLGRGRARWCCRKPRGGSRRIVG